MNLMKYEFSSKEEAKAFLYGINEAMGWFDYQVLNTALIKKLPEGWKKQVEVKQIPL